MASDNELFTGRNVGPYELLVPLAQGATAEVWAARTTGTALEKIVAMKMMRPQEDEDFDAESMFLDEARLVARIRHPNVAAVLDLGEERDLLYLVIEWVEGEPLQIVLREAWNARAPAGQKGVPLPLALRIIKQAASGLHAAHELCDEAGKPIGLVHRDVSPQNILVGYDGSVKVIDFGVAKAASNMQRTRVGQIKGKVPYMAPEQAVGDKVDRRSDVFALGIVLYQLVTGKHPFRADSEFATLVRIRDKTPAESPKVHVADLPDALAEVMLQALAKDREGRFATMADLSRALERASPAPPDVDRSLGAFMGALLSQRSAKRQLAIREALREGTGARPVNFGNKPIFDDGGADAFPAGHSIARSPSSASLPVSRPEIEVEVTMDDDPPSPGATKPAPEAAPISLPDGMGRSSRTTLIVCAVGVVIALALALWFVTTSR